MTVQITVPIDDASLSAPVWRRLLADDGGGVCGGACQIALPPSSSPSKGMFRAYLGSVKDGEPTDIAKDKDKLIGEAVWQEHLEETKQK